MINHNQIHIQYNNSGTNIISHPTNPQPAHACTQALQRVGLRHSLLALMAFLEGINSGTTLGGLVVELCTVRGRNPRPNPHPYTNPDLHLNPILHPNPHPHTNPNPHTNPDYTLHPTHNPYTYSLTHSHPRP